jgi:hypothetical protein
MFYVLTLTFVQRQLSVEEKALTNQIFSHFDASTINAIEPHLQALISRLGQTYLGVTSELSNRSRVRAEDVEKSDIPLRYDYNFVESNELAMHIDQLHNNFLLRYLHVIYEGEEIQGDYLNLSECMAINKFTMQSDCAVVNYGRGKHGELASLQLGFAVYEAVTMLMSYTPEQMPIFLLPFHPLEHFWTRSHGDTTNALIDFDDWYERFRSLEKILRNVGVNFNIIVGHRNWISEPPGVDELQSYCASKVLKQFLTSEVSISPAVDKSESELCHIINVEGVHNELLVTVINWYKSERITNTDLHYEISGKAPIDEVYAFCERYNIEAKTDVKMIEDVSENSLESITVNIQRSLIF